MSKQFKSHNRLESIPQGFTTAPEGHHFRVAFCGACPNAHILVCDERDEFICQFTMTREQALSIADLMETDNEEEEEEGMTW